MATTVERLRDLMADGQLAPGDALRDVQLAARLGVSRPTMREALRRLEACELAVSDGRGLRVATLDADDLRSALLMRASLEGLHAELAARRMAAGEVAPAQLGRVERLAAAAEAATDAGDRATAVLRNREFHQAIDGIADSPVSALAVDRLWDRLLICTQRSLAPPGRGDVVNAEHRELLGAVAAGDHERASAVAIAHVRATALATGAGA